MLSVYKSSCKCHRLLVVFRGHLLRPTITQRRQLRWVPLAYRGAVVPKEKTDTKGGDVDRRDRYKHKNKQQQPPTFSSRFSSRRKRFTSVKEGSNQRGSAAAAAATQTVQSVETAELMEKDLYGLHRRLLRLARGYRQQFSSEPLLIHTTSTSSPTDLLSPSDRRITITYQDSTEQQRSILRAMTRHLRELSSEIHKADQLVEGPQVARTDDLFRSICVSLREMIPLATQLSLHHLSRISSAGETSDQKVKAALMMREDFLALSEVALSTLVKLVSERAILVELTKTWSTNSVPSAATESSSSMFLPAPIKAFWDLLSDPSGRDNFINNPPSTATSSAKAAVPGVKDETTGQNINRNSNPIPKTKQLLAHEDPQIGASPKLFRAVMDCIAASVQEHKQFAGIMNNSEAITMEGKGDEKAVIDDGGTKTITEGVVGTPSSTSEGPLLTPSSTRSNSSSSMDRSYAETTARRMAALLDAMPSTWTPDLETVKDVLEMMCRAGTLASARLCHDTFKRHPSNQNRIRFSLVLQAYLEATKHDPDFSKRVIAAQEAVEVLQSEWHENLPRHRVERIVHSSIVLNCLCASGTKNVEVPGVCDLAVQVVRRCLSNNGYTKLLDEIESKTPVVDPQTLPLVGCLARIYAFSGDAARMQDARRLLSYMMSHDGENISSTGSASGRFTTNYPNANSVGRFVAYPMVETFNAVLTSLVNEFEGIPKKELLEKEAAGRDAVEYATSILDFMLSRRESGCWPNESTFLLLFRLLLAVKPPDIGERAEDALSKMEVLLYFAQRSYSQTRNDSPQMSLSMYHRVLRCWLEAARNPLISSCAAERALKLVEKLEIQSIPLLLSDRETQLPSITTLYNIQLRPTRTTYGLVNQICLETANEEWHKRTVDVVFGVYGQLQRRGMLARDGSDERILLQCIHRLPEGDPLRASAELKLASLQDNSLKKNPLQTTTTTPESSASTSTTVGA